MKACCALICLLASIAAGAQPREIHGASDAFAGEGVTVVWAVLRGATDGDAQVVLRIEANPASYAEVQAAGVDPFTRARTVRFPRLRLTPAATIRVARADFADHPRTEIEFSGPAGRIVVYYLGVPDTAPEFAAAEPLEAYLRQRSATLR